MSSLFDLFQGFWGNVGPGFLLAVAFPFALTGLGLVAVEGYRRVRADR